MVIFILHILKKYSSPKSPLSSHEVMDRLNKDYPIDNETKAEAQRKKIRRLLDTLYESYPGGCIKKKEGKTINGHKWYYDASRDRFANEGGVIQETLTEVEAELLVDLVSATKILNSAGMQGLVDKLLKKTSIPDEDRARRLAALQKEKWFKTPNEDLLEKKSLIETCFDECRITFDYGDEKSITAAPLGWSDEDGICFLNAKVGDNCRKFALDQIRNCDADAGSLEIAEFFGRYDEEIDKTTLDSLFVNIPTVKRAIADKKSIRFTYRSYSVANDRVDFKDEEKCILPHSLVFNDGKYYLIGIDENALGRNKIAYFRVDLMFELRDTETKTKLSDWNEYIFETTERAREVEKHPLMMAGRDVEITFEVVESALDRVIDAFAVKPEQFRVTSKTRAIKESSEEGFHDERIVSVQVRTTEEEAFRWALANADAVELVSPQAIRDRIARLADPIYHLYTQTLSDKVRENIDYVLKEGTFKISYKVDADTAYATYKELAKIGKLGVVDNMGIAGEGAFDNVDYFGEFFNTERLILMAPQIKDLTWVAKLARVKELKLTDSHCEDVSWMKELKKLQRIYLSKSQVSDLSCLSEHKEIDTLDISGTNVSDISFIDSFPKLTQLHIAMCPIADYSPLFTTKSSLKYLEIDKKALERIGEERIRSRHLAISIEVTNSSLF